MHKRKKRIIIAINDFLIGGAQRLIVSQLKYAEYEKYEYHILTLFEFPGRKDLYDFIPAHIPVHRIGMRGAYDFRGWVRLARKIWSVGPTTVFSHLFFANTALRVLKPFLGYTIFTVEHNTYTNKKRWQVVCDRILATLSKRVIAVSEKVKVFTTSQQKLNSDKCVVIPNGTDLSTIKKTMEELDKNEARKNLGIDNNKKVFINVGRLTDQKNHKLLLESLSLASSKYTDLLLIVAGEGSLRQDLEGLSRSLGVEDSVRFIGAVDNIFSYYRASDYLISTSLIEGMSLAYIEALAFGLPIITTKTGGTDELVTQSDNGFIIDEYKPESVISAIDTALAANYEILSNNAKERSMRYDIEHNIESYEKLASE